MYADNYYVSIQVMKFLFVMYSILMVGILNFKKKKFRTTINFPFAKLSNSAIKMVKRGWMRSAFRNVYSNENSIRILFIMKATIYKNKKIVGFLCNYFVELISNKFNI